MNSGCFVERRSGGILQTSAETHILVFLWFCAHKSTTKELSKLFSICFATVHKLILSVIDFLVQIVAPKKIAFPESLEQKNLIANKFEKVFTLYYFCILNSNLFYFRQLDFQMFLVVLIHHTFQFVLQHGKIIVQVQKVTMK